MLGSVLFPFAGSDIGKEPWGYFFGFATHNNIGVRAQIVGIKANIGAAEDHQLAARAKVPCKLYHTVAFQDLAGESDHVGGSIEIDAIYSLVANRDVPIARHKGRKCRDRQIGEIDGIEDPPSIEHFEAVIAGKASVGEIG